MWEELTKIEICELIWWIIEILCLGYPPKLKNEKNMFGWMLKMFFINPFLYKEYYLFSQNSESSIEQ